MGWNLKRDRSEKPIVQALRQAGCQVMLLDKVDLLVWNPRRRSLHLLDAKTGKSKPTEKQDALVRDGWPVHFVTTVEEALRAVGMDYRLEH